MAEMRASQAAAFDMMAQDGILEHRKAMEYLNRAYIKRTVETDTTELAGVLAGFNASDRTPVVKSS